MTTGKEHSHDGICAVAIQAVTDLLTEQGIVGLSLCNLACQIGYVASTLMNICCSGNYLLLAVSATTRRTLHG